MCFVPCCVFVEQSLSRCNVLGACRPNGFHHSETLLSQLQQARLHVTVAPHICNHTTTLSIRYTMRTEEESIYISQQSHRTASIGCKGVNTQYHCTRRDHLPGWFCPTTTSSPSFKPPYACHIHNISMRNSTTVSVAVYTRYAMNRNRERTR